MEPGFAMDRSHGGSPTTQSWIEGEVEKSFWFGLKTGNREKFGVRTFRCEKCGYLESYANAKAEKY
jgi:hypothetical protein